MNRRVFMKHAAAAAALFAFPSLSFADTPLRRTPSLIDQVRYTTPTVMPKVINIFLYGGASELAGNLTNIDAINAKSQNAYPSAMLNGGSEVTASGFWASAGGNAMQRLLDAGAMNVYRTIYRTIDDNKGHGTSTTQNLVGALDTQNAGIATTLANVLQVKHDSFGQGNELILPFVSFEGESTIFNKDNLLIDATLNPVSLDEQLRNPYVRDSLSILDSNSSAALDELARTVSDKAQFDVLNQAFKNRKIIDEFMNQTFSPEAVDANLPTDPATGTKLAYPDTSFGAQLKAAMSLAIENDDTHFISLGRGNGLGGWDDHSDAIDRYTQRMTQLFEAVEIAHKHATLKNKNNIIINIYSEFGRNVNLNNSLGWDHGNVLNFYTIGGSAIAGRKLGHIIGETELPEDAQANVNRLFLQPKADSYKAEPFSIASTIFKYFGVTNPEILTGFDALKEPI